MSICDLSATVFKHEVGLCPDSQTPPVIDREGATVDAAYMSTSHVLCCVSELLGVGGDDSCDKVGDTHLFRTHTGRHANARSKAPTFTS